MSMQHYAQVQRSAAQRVNSKQHSLCAHQSDSLVRLLYIVCAASADGVNHVTFNALGCKEHKTQCHNNSDITHSKA